MCPFSDVDFLPEDEREAAGSIAPSLMQMGDTAKQFRAAIETYIRYKPSPDLFRARDPMEAELFRIGARTAALCLFDFYKAMENINKTCITPTLRLYINKDAKKAAQSRFTSAFPGFEQIRHVAAHPAEMNATEAKRRANAVSIADLQSAAIQGGDEGRVTLQGAIIDDRCVSTVDGQVVGFMLEPSTADTLEEIGRAWVQIFEQAEGEARKAQS